MLLNRSIFLQVCLLIIVSQHSKCEDYESSYESDANDESDHPDYSKYYSTDTSAPLVQGGEGGFSSPIEFSGFFGPEFGESGKQEVKQSKNPFVQEAKTAPTGFVSNSDFPTDFFAESHSHYPKDYFEEAQKEQQNEQSENDDESYNVSPGPNYISHQLPTIKEVADFSTEVEHVKPKITKNKYRKNEKHDKDYEESLAEADKYKLNDYPYDNSKYATDYTIGKSSSTLSQKPKSSGYYAKSTATPTPYQKYSFQPVTEGFEVKSKYLGDLISTVAPFNPAYNKLASTPSTLLFEGAPSEAIPSQLKGHNCKRVTRNVEKKDVDTGELKEDSMNCFVCEDPKTSSEYTHCSYVSEPDTKNDYSGSSIRYSTPTRDNEDGFRYKRYSGDDYSANPYEYIRGRSQKAQKEAEDTKQYDEYKLPDYYGFDDDKSYSETQSEQIKQNPANCKKEEKKGMTCTVCKDPKTGGNFEQCSYTSAPQEQKYAYASEKKYDSNDDEPGEESEESKKNPQIAKKDEKESVQDKKDKIPETVIQDYIKQKVPTTVDYKKEPRYEESNTKYTKFGDYDDSIKKEKSPTPSKLKKYNEHKNKYTKLTNYKPEDHEHKFSKLEKFDPEEHEEKRGQSQTKERYHFKNPVYDEAKEYVTGPSPSAKPTKLVDDDPYDVPKHFAESTIKERQTGGKGLEPSLYGSSDESSAEAQEEEEENNEEAESESDDVQPYKDIDEYHFKLFPEFSNEESQQAEVVAATPKDDASRKDVEEVLAEFSKKDRSSCKKAEKNGMTCYLCVDKKGIQHEECMYVSESKPQASHVAYHEVKQIKSPENGENQQLEQTIPAATEIKRKRFFKKVTTTPLPFTLDEAASEEIETKIRYKPTKSRKRNQKKAKELKSSSSNKSKNYSERIDGENEPQQKTPQEFEVGPTEGAYSAETKPVYSKVLGVRLPKYMIEKSEFEKEFDEFSGSF